MNFGSMDRRALADGQYYYCAHCGHWFGTREPSPGRECPDCGSRWENARGTFTKETETTTTVVPSPPPGPTRRSPSGFRYVVMLVVLLGSCLVYQSAFPAVSRAWSNVGSAWSDFTEGVAAFSRHMGNAYLSLGAQSAATLLLFGLFAALILLFVFAVLSFESVVSPGEYPGPAWQRTRRTVSDYGVFFGTAVNLVSSLCALVVVSWIFQRPPDFVDFGIQFVLALMIEYVIWQMFS